MKRMTKERRKNEIDNTIVVYICIIVFVVILNFSCGQGQKGPAPLPVKVQPIEPTIIRIVKLDTMCRYYIQKNDYIKVDFDSRDAYDEEIKIYFDAPCGMYNIGDTLKVMR